MLTSPNSFRDAKFSLRNALIFTFKAIRSLRLVSRLKPLKSQGTCVSLRKGKKGEKLFASWRGRKELGGFTNLFAYASECLGISVFGGCG
jgi:hypothetical protein